MKSNSFFKALLSNFHFVNIICLQLDENQNAKNLGKTNKLNSEENLGFDSGFGFCGFLVFLVALKLFVVFPLFFQKTQRKLKENPRLFWFSTWVGPENKPKQAFWCSKWIGLENQTSLEFFFFFFPKKK